MQKGGLSFYRTLICFFDWLLLMVIYLLVASLVNDFSSIQRKYYLYFFYVLNLSWLVSVFIIGLYNYVQKFDYILFIKKSFLAFILTALFILLFYYIDSTNYTRYFIFRIIYILFITLMVSRLIIYYSLMIGEDRIVKKVVLIGDKKSISKLVPYFKEPFSFVRVQACFIEDTEPEYSKLSFHSNIFKDNDILVNGNVDDGFSKKIIHDYNTMDRTESFIHRKINHQPKPYFHSFYLDSLQDCLSYSINNNISEIYSTLSPELRPELYDFAKLAEKHFIQLKFIPDLSIFIRDASLVDYVYDLPVLALRSFPLDKLSNRMAKRFLDIIVSLFVIIFIMSWLTPLLAILIKLESKGPVFFTQLRSGKSNKSFTCFKFRSLYRNNILESRQVTKNDGRVTKLGKFLRKSNLDELPQFFNVLMGTMSVVGPRPHMLKHTLEFDGLHEEYMVRHFIKPGVTGLAQINGFRGEIRNVGLLKKRIEYDLLYLENWTLWEDIRLILATIFVSLRGDENAY